MKNHLIIHTKTISLDNNFLSLCSNTYTIDIEGMTWGDVSARVQKIAEKENINSIINHKCAIYNKPIPLELFLSKGQIMVSNMLNGYDTKRKVKNTTNKYF